MEWISRPNLCENPILGATLGATLRIGWTPKFQPEVFLLEVSLHPLGSFGGVPTTPDLILLQEHRDTNGSRIVIQIAGVYTTFCQEEGETFAKVSRCK